MKAAILAVLAVTAGVFAWTRTNNVPPPDLRDAVKDAPVSAVETLESAGGSRAGVALPKAAQPVYLTAGNVIGEPAGFTFETVRVVRKGPALIAYVTDGLKGKYYFGYASGGALGKQSSIDTYVETTVAGKGPDSINRGQFLIARNGIGDLLTDGLESLDFATTSGEILKMELRFRKPGGNWGAITAFTREDFIKAEAGTFSGDADAYISPAAMAYILKYLR